VEHGKLMTRTPYTTRRQITDAAFVAGISAAFTFALSMGLHAVQENWRPVEWLVAIPVALACSVLVGLFSGWWSIRSDRHKTARHPER
jgi:predicted lysophospholipase L1 biosynthesis ABC-type transport system permease subunit